MQAETDFQQQKLQGEKNPPQTYLDTTEIV